jgi:hypothetical protein
LSRVVLNDSLISKEANMKRAVVVGAVIALLISLTPQVRAITVDEIIEKAVGVRGGIEAWTKVQTFRVEGTANMGQGNPQTSFLFEHKRPDSCRFEVTVQGQTGVQAVAGGVGWSLMPHRGVTRPQPLDQDQVVELLDQTDIEGPLIGYREKGHTIELVGTEEVDGGEAYKLKIVKKNGQEILIYIDTETFAERKQETTRLIGNSLIQVTTVVGDLKKVGDLVFPHLIKINYGPDQMIQEIVYTSVEIDVEIPDERFAMPESAETGAEEPEG